MLKFFTARVARNLRLVLLLDPSHPHFASVAAQCPAVARRCEVIVLEGWRPETMTALPTHQLAAALPGLADRLPPTLPATLASIHVRKVGCMHVANPAAQGSQVGASPHDYQELIACLGRILSTQHTQLVQQHDFLQVGLLSMTMHAYITVRRVGWTSWQRRSGRWRR